MKWQWVIAAALGLFLLGDLPVAAQAGPSLLITEVYYDTPGVDGEEEWIEIANVGTAVLDLSDVTVGDEETAGGGEGMARFPDGAGIEPGQAVVVAQTAVGFRRLFGFNPDFELVASDDTVPTMRGFPLWATGDVALANDGDEVLLLADFALLDAINYGDSAAYFAPSISAVITGQSIARVPANCDSDSAADWQPQPTPTPGVLSFAGECAAPVNPALREELPPIGAIQGAGDVSPLVNQLVTFRGVVTGVMADRNAAGVTFHTIFVQDLPGREDGDPATSDGIAVFLGRERPSVQSGDQVRVTGQVIEFFGLTEIDDRDLEILVEAGEQPLPPPVDLPALRGADLPAALEPLESMVVRVDGAAPVVGPTFGACSFAVAGAETAAAHIFQRSSEPPVAWVLPILHTTDTDCTGFPQVKVGDTVTGLAGPLTYHFDEFKIVQQAADRLTVTAAPLPPLPTPPEITADQVSIATVNVQNYFDAVDDTGLDAEPKPSPEAIAIRQQKLTRVVHAVLGCPTLVGVQEVEKAALLHDLAQLLVEPCGFRYQVSHRESPDVRGIDVALLSNPQRVTVQSIQLRQTCTQLQTGIADASITCPAGEQPLHSRPPLQVTVQVDGRPMTLFVNHLKSKREGEAETAAWRLAQARHLSVLVSELLARDAQAQVVVMGDLNDYEQSQPLQLLMENGRLTNVLLQVPSASRYSFIFGGRAQLIDGILLSSALAEQVESVQIQHVNADFPAAWRSDVDRPWRAADHDFPLVVLSLPRPAEEVVATAVATVPPTDLPPIAPETTAGEDDVKGLWWLVSLGVFTGIGIIGYLIWQRR